MQQFTAIIIGSGFGGQAAAVNLRRIGIDDFLILERRPWMGGTWSQNSYPGAYIFAAPGPHKRKGKSIHAKVTPVEKSQRELFVATRPGWLRTSNILFRLVLFFRPPGAAKWPSRVDCTNSRHSLDDDTSTARTTIESEECAE